MTSNVALVLLCLWCCVFIVVCVRRVLASLRYECLDVCVCVTRGHVCYGHLRSCLSHVVLHPVAPVSCHDVSSSPTSVWSVQGDMHLLPICQGECSVYLSTYCPSVCVVLLVLMQVLLCFRTLGLLLVRRAVPGPPVCLHCLHDDAASSSFCVNRIHTQPQLTPCCLFAFYRSSQPSVMHIKGSMQYACRLPSHFWITLNTMFNARL